MARRERARGRPPCRPRLIKSEQQRDVGGAGGELLRALCLIRAVPGLRVVSHFLIRNYCRNGLMRRYSMLQAFVCTRDGSRRSMVIPRASLAQSGLPMNVHTVVDIGPLACSRAGYRRVASCPARSSMPSAKVRTCGCGCAIPDRRRCRGRGRRSSGRSPRERWQSDHDLRRELEAPRLESGILTRRGPPPPASSGDLTHATSPVRATARSAVAPRSRRTSVPRHATKQLEAVATTHSAQASRASSGTLRTRRCRRPSSARSPRSCARSRPCSTGTRGTRRTSRPCTRTAR